MIVLIDNGHGNNTPGKCSPDRSILEYKYCREIAKGVSRRLSLKGLDARLLVLEEYDVSLKERCRRVNAYVNRYGRDGVLCVSVHLNAAPPNDDKWHEAKGWSVCVSNNASVSSKALAGCLNKAAVAEGLKVRNPAPGQAYWVQDLAVCRDTHCPAVLTENLFQDNKEEVRFLNSDAGRQAIINLHVNGVIAYVTAQGKKVLHV